MCDYNTQLPEHVSLDTVLLSAETLRSDIEQLRQHRQLLLETLEQIKALSDEWDANKMGGVSIQRKRWKKLGAIAYGGIAQVRGEMTKE